MDIKFTKNSIVFDGHAIKGKWHAIPAEDGFPACCVFNSKTLIDYNDVCYLLENFAGEEEPENKVSVYVLEGKQYFDEIMKAVNA